MVSTATMSKTNRTWIARRKRLATWALLVACACLSLWPHGASAAEINAATAAKPAGFADIVAKVKPAVIAVTVRLESDAQVSDTDEAPSQSRPYTEKREPDRGADSARQGSTGRHAVSAQ